MYTKDFERKHSEHSISVSPAECYDRIHKYILFADIYAKLLNKIYLFEVGRDRVVGIATHYGLGGLGIISRWGARFSAPVETGPGAHPASCTMGTGLFPGG